MPQHATLSGHVVTYEAPTGSMATYFDRYAAMLDDERATERDMAGVLYNPDNPLLDRTQSVLHKQGVVTAKTLKNPLYHVMVDLLVRKHVREHDIDVQAMADAHTLTVPEAAERLQVHESAVRQAIASRRLASWMKHGQHYLTPSAVKACAIGRRSGRTIQEKP